MEFAGWNSLFFENLFLSQGFREKGYKIIFVFLIHFAFSFMQASPIHLYEHFFNCTIHHIQWNNSHWK